MKTRRVSRARSAARGPPPGLPGTHWPASTWQTRGVHGAATIRWPERRTNRPGPPHHAADCAAARPASRIRNHPPWLHPPHAAWPIQAAPAALPAPPWASPGSTSRWAAARSCRPATSRLRIGETAPVRAHSCRSVGARCSPSARRSHAPPPTQRLPSGTKAG